MCQLLLSMPHNGRLAALLPEITRGFPQKRTGVHFLVRSRRNPIVFDFTVRGKCSYLTAKGVKWKLKCPVGMAYLPVPALWKEILTIPMDKKLGQLK